MTAEIMWLKFELFSNSTKYACWNLHAEIENPNIVWLSEVLVKESLVKNSNFCLKKEIMVKTEILI